MGRPVFHWRVIVQIVLTFYIWFYAPDPERVLHADPKPVAIKVNPRVGISPVTPRITVRVERHEGNRKLCLYWGKDGWDPEFYESSCREHNPDAPITIVYNPTGARRLDEGGVWHIIAVLQRNDESIYKAQETVEVRGRFGE